MGNRIPIVKDDIIINHLESDLKLYLSDLTEKIENQYKISEQMEKCSYEVQKYAIYINDKFHKIKLELFINMYYIIDEIFLFLNNSKPYIKIGSLFLRIIIKMKSNKENEFLNMLCDIKYSCEKLLDYQQKISEKIYALKINITLILQISKEISKSKKVFIQKQLGEFSNNIKQIDLKMCELIKETNDIISKLGSAQKTVYDIMNDYNIKSVVDKTVSKEESNQIMNCLTFYKGDLSHVSYCERESMEFYIDNFNRLWKCAMSSTNEVIDQADTQIVDTNNDKNNNTVNRENPLNKIKDEIKARIKERDEFGYLHSFVMYKNKQLSLLNCRSKFIKMTISEMMYIITRAKVETKNNIKQLIDMEFIRLKVKNNWYRNCSVVSLWSRIEKSKKSMNNYMNKVTQFISVLDNFKNDTNIEEDEDEVCSICLEHLTQGAYENITELICAHIFHKNCINRWFKKQDTCPNCRKVKKNTENDVSDLDLIYLFITKKKRLNCECMNLLSRGFNCIISDLKKMLSEMEQNYNELVESKKILNFDYCLNAMLKYEDNIFDTGFILYLYFKNKIFGLNFILEESIRPEMEYVLSLVVHVNKLIYIIFELARLYGIDLDKDAN